MNDIFQNLFGGLDPTQNQTSIDVEDFMPKDPEIDELKNRYKQNQERAARAQTDIERYQKALEFDPISAANKRYKDKYKWKGASPLRKLGTVGFGLLDAFSHLDKRGGIKGEIDRQEQKRFDNLQSTIPGQITTERLTQQNANNVMTDMQRQSELRDKNNATIAYKNALMKMTGAAQQEKLKQGWEKLEQTGQLNSANIKKVIADAALSTEKAKTAGLAKNPFEAAQLMQTENNPVKDKPAFMRDLTDMFKAQGKARPSNSRPYGLQKIMGPPAKELSVDNSGNLVEKDYRKIDLFDPDPRANLSPAQRLTAATSATGKVMDTSSPDYKRLKEIDYGAKLMEGAAASILDDVATGNIQKFAGINDTGILAAARRLTNNDPYQAAAINGTLQQASIATMAHVRAINGGGRPALAFIEGIENVLQSKAGSPQEKATAILSQSYIMQMSKLSQLGNAEAESFFRSPDWANFLSKKIASMESVSRQTGRAVTPPNIMELIEEFKSRRAKGDSGKPAAEATPRDRQINPIADDRARKIKEALLK
ncbi:hypothetical protein UFOVP434_36 [uncultured Caudovirales phage]|uniref:Uncharacterized protein n=1 Tax=uncultured Caudovirales phage TaxID=2100421 RepID=A0A6J5MCR9_9CAUD|nr:hypothetical protein UFOVP434_36 [uncultured Caudovirales phage]